MNNFAGKGIKVGCEWIIWFHLKVNLFTIYYKFINLINHSDWFNGLYKSNANK